MALRRSGAKKKNLPLCDLSALRVFALKTPIGEPALCRGSIWKLGIFFRLFEQIQGKISQCCDRILLIPLEAIWKTQAVSKCFERH